MDLVRSLSLLRTWGLTVRAGDDIGIGPLAHFDERTLNHTVSIVPTAAIGGGTPESHVHVHENAQEFDVTYYRFVGYRGLWHTRGRNWIVWTEDLRHVFMSDDNLPPERAWVHVRFVLRHWMAAHLLSRSGFRRTHAVAGPLSGSPNRAGLLIAGPYLSGKTFLIHRLIEQGLVDALWEDDCAILDADWQAHCLVPQSDAICWMRRLPIQIMVCLDQTASRVEQIAAPIAARWAMRLSASWPLSWLPGAPEIQTTVAGLPERLVCFRAPERPSSQAVSAAIAEALASS